MVKNYKISTPFFEFGPKAYLYGEELLELMKKIDTFAQKYDMDVIADVQTTDLRLIAENTSDRIHVYSQHMDSIPVGRGMGTILPEAVKATGAVGVMLNHAECKLTLDEVKEAIKRAEEVGLATIVCADTEDEIKVRELKEYFKWSSYAGDYAGLLLTLITMNDYVGFTNSIRLTEILRLSRPTTQESESQGTHLIEK